MVAGVVFVSGLAFLVGRGSSGDGSGTEVAVGQPDPGPALQPPPVRSERQDDADKPGRRGGPRRVPHDRFLANEDPADPGDTTVGPPKKERKPRRPERRPERGRTSEQTDDKPRESDSAPMGGGSSVLDV